jgi:hypothetical protein
MSIVSPILEGPEFGFRDYATLVVKFSRRVLG